jgi:hypothetical protein
MAWPLALLFEEWYNLLATLAQPPHRTRPSQLYRREMTLAKSIQEARTQVEGLVERFARNLAPCKRADYKEQQVRVEFINPFFEALGWDMGNTKGYAETYKDVIHEDAIRLGRSLGAPDYCFRIGGTRKFFLEAKKPSVSASADVGRSQHPRRQEALRAADRRHRAPDRRAGVRVVRAYRGRDCHRGGAER